MRKIELTVDGDVYVAIPRAEYLHLIGEPEEETVDALAFTRATLGHNLRAAREHAGLTQAELSKKLKKAQTTVSQSEAGKISVSAAYVAKVLKVCGLPVDWKAPR
jgi:ribosome-binding protein aMBF1 (putative translation factor)